MFLPRFYSGLSGGFPLLHIMGIPLRILALHLFPFRDVVLKNLYDFLSVVHLCFHSGTYVSTQAILSLLLKFLNLSHSETF